MRRLVLASFVVKKGKVHVSFMECLVGCRKASSNSTSEITSSCLPPSLRPPTLSVLLFCYVCYSVCCLLPPSCFLRAAAGIVLVGSVCGARHTPASPVCLTLSFSFLWISLYTQTTRYYGVVWLNCLTVLLLMDGFALSLALSVSFFSFACCLLHVFGPVC